MANYTTDRQELITACVEVTYADLTSATAYNAVQLPENAVLVGGQYRVSTAFDSGTSDAVVVAFNSLTLLTDADAQAAVLTAFTMPTTSNPNNVEVSTPAYVTLTWTGAGTAPTAGAITLHVQYLEKGRSAFSQG